MQAADITFTGKILSFTEANTKNSKYSK